MHCGNVLKAIPNERHLEAGEGEVVAVGHVELVALLEEGVDVDCVLEDDGAPLLLELELHRVVVDGAGVVVRVHQQLADVGVERVEVESRGVMVISMHRVFELLIHNSSEKALF